MAISVKKLIAELKKQNQNAVVVFQTHDQSQDEIDGFVNVVEQGSEYLANLLEKSAIVILRP